MEKKSNSLNKAENSAYANALIPTQNNFFQKNSLINLKTLLGDAAFDSIGIYKCLLQETSFEKTYNLLKTSYLFLVNNVLYQYTNYLLEFQ